MKKQNISPFLIAVALVALVCLSISLRINHLEGDPPVGDISRSGVFYMDEGTYAHSAVNKILFGSWFLRDDYNAMPSTPVFSLAQYIILKTFGVSIRSLRIGAIIYASIFLFSLWVLLQHVHSRGALLAVFFGSINYFFIVYNRIALLENLLVLMLMLIAVSLYYYSQKQRVCWLVMAVIFLWAGYFIKATILFVLPLVLFTIVVQPLHSRKKLRHLWIYFTVSSIILVVMYLVWVQPQSFDWSYFQHRNIHRMINRSFPYILMNYGRYIFNLKLFQFMPVTYTIYIFYCLYLLVELVRKKRLAFLDWYFLMWTVCAILFLGFFTYSPPRFSLILIPAVFILVTRFFVRLFTNQLDLSPRWLTFLLIPLSFVVLCQIAFGIYRISVYNKIYPSCFLPILGIPVVIILYYMLKKPSFRKSITIGLIAAIVMLNSFQIIYFYHTMTFSYHQAIEDIKHILAAGDTRKNVLLGDIASLVAIDLQCKAVNINFRSDTESVRIMHNNPNLLILQDNEELERLAMKVPDYLANVELIKRYSILNNYVTHDDTYFYRIHNKGTDISVAGSTGKAALKQ